MENSGLKQHSRIWDKAIDGGGDRFESNFNIWIQMWSYTNLSGSLLPTVKLT